MKRFAFAFAFLASPAAAELVCSPFDVLAPGLAENYGEAPQSWGLTGGGSRVIVTLASPETGTWTILAIDRAGEACIIAQGVGFAEIAAIEGNPA